MDKTIAYFYLNKEESLSPELIQEVEQHIGVVGIAGYYDGQLGGSVGLQHSKVLSVDLVEGQYVIVVEYDHPIIGG